MCPGKRFAHKGVVPGVDHAHSRKCGRAPPGIDQAEFLVPREPLRKDPW